MKKMSVPFCAHVDAILRESEQAGVLLIVAPTGTGKTTGVCGLIRARPDVFGTTTIVQPTRMAARAAGVGAVPPGRMIERFLREKRFGCDTLVLDEAHAPSVEYHTLFSFLRGAATRPRVILMTATPDTAFLEGFFPDMRVLRLNATPPYPTIIHYDPIPGGTLFPSCADMTSHVARMLQKHPGHRRVLVFVYTHDQCERMARELLEMVVASCGGGTKTFALHGGTDLAEWAQFIQHEERFVVFATNAAEASVTIPSLSLVVDFGVRCVRRNHRIVYNNCPQVNLVQRAGRVGRTCPGVVVRCMTEENFLARPAQDAPSHNWDLMVLRVMWHGHDPVVLLPATLGMDAIRRKFRFYGLENADGRLDRRAASFVLRSPLSLKNSCHLYYFMSRRDVRQNDAFLALCVAACALIDQVETHMSRVYYYASDAKMTRHRLIGKLRRAFDPPDELFFHLHPVLSCVLSAHPARFAKAFSLNYRTVRQVAAAVSRTWGFIGAGTRVPWREAVGRMLAVRTARPLTEEGGEPQEIRIVAPAHVDALRGVYMACPFTPRMLLINDMIWRPNLVIESYNCAISPFVQAHGRNRCVLILSHDDADVDRWSDRTAVFDDIATLSFSLYTFPPTPVDRFVHDLHGAVRLGFFEHNALKKRKEIVRRRFERVLRDVREDVAYRPGFWAMQESIEAFMRFVEGNTF